MASTDSFWSKLSVQAKIFSLTLFLVLGITGAVLLYSYSRANSLAQQSLTAALAATRDLYENLEEDRIEKLALINSVIVESPYFKAAVAEMDQATTLDSARDMVDQVGSDFMIVTDFDGIVVARTDVPAATGDDLSQTPLVAYAIEGESVGGVFREGERLYHAVSVPLAVGAELLGAVITGYEIEDALALYIKRFADCEVVFFADTEEGYVEAGSTLAENTATLRDWLAGESMPAEASDVRLQLGGEEYQAIFAPLTTAEGDSVGTLAALRSRDRELAAFRTFQRSVLIVGLLGILLSVLVSHFLAGGVVRPLKRLVRVTDRIREGDYSSDVDVRSGDEIGVLANAFDELLAELREKQQMEKFLSRSAAEMIQRTDTSPAVGGERRPVTVLFSDLKAHAAIQGGGVEASELLARVNYALSQQADLVERYGGQVDKFVGDRMMAVFKGEDRVWPAIRCAISIQHLREVDDKSDANSFVPGIGISTGDAIFGAVGSAKRLDYSLLGPAVHIAARLADEAPPGDVLLSQPAFEQVREKATAESLPPIRVHGLSEEIAVYSLATGTLRQRQLARERTASVSTSTSTTSDPEDTVVTTDGQAPPPSSITLEPGSILAHRYEIRRVLGSGGMGMVFQAMDRDLDEPVAIKVLRNEIATMDPTSLERFKTEIRVARRITHRNVVRTFDFGDAQGVKFITMEFVQGMTLKQLIRKNGALPIRVGLQIAKQATAGLVAAHEQGVVHRDVKPQNIMLTPQGDVKIMDFGIVREKGKSEITQAGLVMGTPEYMSPEQAQGKLDLDHRSDVYSLGVVLFETFTGALPFKADTPFATALKHVQEEPPLPKTIQPQVPDALSALIMRCMKKKPDERYRSVKEVLGELHRISSAARPAASASTSRVA